MVNIIIFPSHCLFNISHKFLLEVISIPLEGSSRKITSLPPIKDIAIDNFLLWPADKFLASIYSILSIWKSFNVFFISLLTSDDLTPLNIENISKCSLTVKSSNKVSCWGQIPNFLLNISILWLSNTLSPSYKAFPFVASYIPVNIEINVVFPAPLCPNKANISSL